MPSIKSLGMAAAVSAHNNITIKKSFFSTKAIYTPTGSPVKAMVLEYSPTEGEEVKRLLDLQIAKIPAEVSRKGKPRTGSNGNFRLEVCLSDDHQFCSLQLFRYVDFIYQPLFEPRFYEGKDVEPLLSIF